MKNDSNFNIYGYGEFITILNNGIKIYKEFGLSCPINIDFSSFKEFINYNINYNVEEGDFKEVFIFLNILLKFGLSIKLELNNQEECVFE